MQISQMVDKLWSGHKYMMDISIKNFQRAVTLKVCKQELWFLCSTCFLMVLYIYVQFHENISNSFQVTE